MKKLLTTTLALLSISHSQAQTFDWSVPFSGNTFSKGLGIVTDIDGNTLTTGVFSGTVDFDPSAGIEEFTALNEDIYITKQDVDGNLIWARQIGSFGGDIGREIALDNAGNIFLTGTFQGTVDFDPTATEYVVTGEGAQDIFILKLNADGEFIWVKTIGGSDFEDAYKVKIDASNNIYICGLVNNGTVDFDPGAGTAFLTSFYDSFILKLNSAGDFVWVKQFTNVSDIVMINDFTIDASNNIYTTGRFLGTANFNTTGGVTNLTSAGGNDVFIAKLNSTGGLQWAKQIGGTGSDIAYGIAFKSSGNICLTGHFSSSVDFDPSAGVETLTSVGDRDIFVCQLNSDGDFAWAKSFGGVDYDEGSTIALSSNGAIYIGGAFSSTADFDPGIGTSNLVSFGGYDGFLLKLNSTGELQNTWQYGGTGGDWMLDLAIDLSDNVVLTGYFAETADLDPTAAVLNYTTSGGADAFVGRLAFDDVSTHSMVQENRLMFYPNPAITNLAIQTNEKIELIHIYSAHGELVQVENSAFFSVQHLIPGTYIIRVQTAAGTYQHQFVKL